MKENEKSELEEIQSIFSQLGASEAELAQWVEKISLDRRKTESCMIDLVLCTFVKKGLNAHHVRRLSRIMRHEKFRTVKLVERIDYIKKHIVEE